MFMHEQTSICSGPNRTIHRAHAAHLYAFKYILLGGLQQTQNFEKTLTEPVEGKTADLTRALFLHEAARAS